MYDIIIIGAGPAGLTAAIYAKRAGYSALLLEGGTPAARRPPRRTLRTGRAASRSPGLTLP